MTTQAQEATCGKIPMKGSLIDPCSFPPGHPGGCTWESEDAWQPVPDPCPSCGAAPAVEIRTIGMPPQAVRSEYRCHNCQASGPAVPRG